MARELPELPLGSQGFLTEVPFLREVPPHIQVELLAQTWQKHIAEEKFTATMMDESVVYAACETASYIVRKNSEMVSSLLAKGPIKAKAAADESLADELQQLHLNLANEGDFLLISQFLDMAPVEAGEWQKRYGLSEDDLEPMFEALGRWFVASDVSHNLSGLLTPIEIQENLPLLGLTLPKPAES